MLKLFVPEFLKLSGHTVDFWWKFAEIILGRYLASSWTLGHAKVDKCPISSMTFPMFETFKHPLLSKKIKLQTYSIINSKTAIGKKKKKSFLPPYWVSNRLWMHTSRSTFTVLISRRILSYIIFLSNSLICKSFFNSFLNKFTYVFLFPLVNWISFIWVTLFNTKSTIYECSLHIKILWN